VYRYISYHMVNKGSKFLKIVNSLECRIILGILPVGLENVVEPRPGGLPATRP